MKTCKKMAAVAMVLLLICQLMGLSAGADTVTVKLVGEPCGAVEGSTYVVTLQVSDPAVGGVQGAISYDPALFDYESTSMPESLVTANLLTVNADETVETGEAVRVDETAGTVKFALLSDKTSNDWMTLTFTVKEATQAISISAFTLSDVRVADVAGSSAATSDAISVEQICVSDVALTAEGSTIRTNGTYDLRFEVSLTPDFMGLQDVAQVGVILVPTALVTPGAQLQNDPTGKSFCVTSGGVQVQPQIATMDFDAESQDLIDGVYKIYANISKTAEKHMNREYSLRAFVVMTDGSIVYADNTKSENNKNIADGTISRSCKSTAKMIYATYAAEPYSYPYSEAVVAVIEEKTGDWTAEDYALVAAENRAAYVASLS